MTDDSNRCIAETRSKPTHYASPHTYRCQLEHGHEGGHKWTDGTRSKLWFGEARQQSQPTRFRFGTWVQS
jgi:hypothetical protein